MRLTYYGHSSILIEGKQTKILIDPFLSGNPACKIDPDSLKGITHIFVTHGHGDHIGDTVKIAKNNNAIVICNHELGFYFAEKGVKTHTMHIGGAFKMDFGRVKMTNALHGSGVQTKDGLIEGGNPCGFVIDVDGKRIYHAGDTGLTMDMKLLENENIDIALLPIGGNFTMDIDDAVRAVEFIKPKIVIPIHYNTFKLIEANPQEFKTKVKNSEVRILDYNEFIEM